MKRMSISILVITMIIFLSSCVTATNKYISPKLNLVNLKVGIVYVNGYEAGIAESYISTELLKKGSNVIERAMLQSIVQEQRLQLSGLTDTETAIKIGEIANVDSVFLANISMPAITNRANWVDNTWQTYSVTFSGKLVNVETGSVLMSGTSTGSRGFPDRALSDAVKKYFND